MEFNLAAILSVLGFILGLFNLFNNRRQRINDRKPLLEFLSLTPKFSALALHYFYLEFINKGAPLKNLTVQALGYNVPQHNKIVATGETAVIKLFLNPGQRLYVLKADISITVLIKFEDLEGRRYRHRATFTQPKGSMSGKVSYSDIELDP